MNKMKKLLSVVLAVVLAFSAFSVLGSAAKTAYKTVDELTALDAYSPYGQVTRLSLEERTSIVFDALDNLLAKANINPGTLLNVNLVVTKLTLTVNLTSIDYVCDTLDEAKSLLSNGLVSVAKAIVNLGILEDLSLSSWATGMSRDGTDNFTILAEILEVLSTNTDLVESVLTNGIDLGIVSLGDMSTINELVTDLPSALKGMIYPMIERWDDSLAVIRELDASIAGTSEDYTSVENVANWRVKKLFSDNMSITTVKYDANGNMTSEHTGMPISTTAPGTPSDSSPRCYYHITGTTPGSVMTVYHIVDAAEAEALAKTPDKVNGSPAAYTYFKEAQTYILVQEVEGSETYVWAAADENGNRIVEGGWSMKWYNDDSQLLPGITGDDIDLQTMSAGQLLYKFIPVVFEQMAPVVLNGSVKKLLAEFVGADFTYVGDVGSDAVAALPDASNTFFTEEQGEYLWEWSNYAVINGNHYYRFEDQIFAGSLDNVNNYFDIIDWNYEITPDFMDEFIPTSDSDATDRVLLNVADFLTKVANEVLLESAETDDTRTDHTATWTRPTFAAGNANLVSNVKALAQAVVGLAPQHIFGDDYETNPRCYVELMLSDDNDTVLVGIAAHLVNMIMPSMTLPGKDEILASGAKVGAILAAVIREFAAYLAPEYNFDALIYEDFGVTTDDPVKTFVSGKDSSYWLDVCLTMGINVGFEYLRAFADMGEGTDEWNNFISTDYTTIPYAPDGMTYAAGTTQEALNAHWEGMLDYIIDWALEKDYEWTWKMENLADTTGLTIDLGLAQDPWVKLQTILGKFLPVDEILTVEPTGDQTKIEHFLRDDLILGIVDLKWDHLINTIQFNGTNKYFRTANVLDQLAALLKGIVNNLLGKVFGIDLIPSAITDFDTLATHSNIKTLVVNLVGALYTAGDANGGCDTLMPFLNFLLGWKTDPQVIADPVIWTTFRDNNDYAYLWKDGGFGAGSDIGDGATVIKVLNNSAGMLETHRNSSVTDHAYEIQIKSVTSDATANTITFTYDNVVSPYETVDIVVGGTYQTDEAITVTIAYDYIGKDGQAVGGTQYTSTTFFMSNLYEDANIDGRFDGDDDEDYAGIDQYKKYQFTEDIYDTVTNFEPTIFATTGTTGATGSRDFVSITAPDNETDCDGNVTTSHDMTGLAPDKFDYITDRAEAGWEETKPAEGSISGKLYKAASGVNENTAFDYGIYDMGRYAIKYGDDSKVWEIQYIYYNDYDVDKVYADNKENGYNANQGVDSAIYNEYNAAWKDIVKYATYPMMTTAAGSGSDIDYVSAIMPNIESAIARFEAAKEAYEEALAEAQATGAAGSALPEYVQNLEAELANDDGDGELEINFQDYDFYEYFNYADLRTAHRNFVKTYYAPELMDEYYIYGSGIREAELNNVIAAESNAAIAAGIEASKLRNNQAAIDAAQAAHDEWVMPVNSKLLVDDMTSRLAYYRQFVNDSVKEDADHLYFLNQEIAHIDAQQLQESKYEANSWARFKDAYDYAAEVAAGTAEYADYNSIIYNAKWNLMVAYKELLLKADSLIEAGGTADLEANIEIAEGIFAMSMDEITLTDEAIAAGITKEAALGQLISALGYYYVGEDGNTWNLYADSAYEYADNDRPNRQSNQAKVDVANANLETAIANFAIETAAPELIVSEYGAMNGVVVDKMSYNANGAGFIYGINTDYGETIDSYFETPAGSIVVTPNANGAFSTGATVQLLDTAGNVVETYHFIFLGDVNGDGFIDAIDVSIADGIAGYMDFDYYGGDGTCESMAMDMNGDGFIDAIDVSMMDGIAGYMDFPTQADLAASVATMKGIA